VRDASAPTAELVSEASPLSAAERATYEQLLLEVQRLIGQIPLNSADLLLLVRLENLAIAIQIRMYPALRSTLAKMDNTTRSQYLSWCAALVSGA
jgi:hypothetical protein